MNRFRECLTHVFGSEGGYVNNPNDPGGETKYGITKRDYPHLDIRNLTLEQAGEIYRKNYWEPCHAPSLPRGLDLAVFDMAVNCGVRNAVTHLQEAAGTTPDGDFGPKTLAAVRAADPRRLLEDFLWLRARYYARITVKNHKLREFMPGWIFRVIKVRKDAA